MDSHAQLLSTTTTKQPFYSSPTSSGLLAPCETPTLYSTVATSIEDEMRDVLESSFCHAGTGIDLKLSYGSNLFIQRRVDVHDECALRISNDQQWKISISEHPLNSTAALSNKGGMTLSNRFNTIRRKTRAALQAVSHPSHQDTILVLHIVTPHGHIMLLRRLSEVTTLLSDLRVLFPEKVDVAAFPLSHLGSGVALVRSPLISEMVIASPNTSTSALNCSDLSTTLKEDMDDSQGGQSRKRYPSKRFGSMKRALFTRHHTQDTLIRKSNHDLDLTERTDVSLIGTGNPAGHTTYDTSPKATLIRLAACLTDLANDLSIRSETTWYNFVKLRTGDIDLDRGKEKGGRITIDEQLKRDSLNSICLTRRNGKGVYAAEKYLLTLPLREDMSEFELEFDTVAGAQPNKKSYEEDDSKCLAGYRDPKTYPSLSQEQPLSGVEDGTIKRQESKNPISIGLASKQNSFEDYQLDDTPLRHEIPIQSSRKRQRTKITLQHFDCIRVLGKGCAGKVLLVRHKKTHAVFALKAIRKAHVLAHRELIHTRAEQIVLEVCSRQRTNPFVVHLHFSFHDKDTLYLALDFHPGGDLATQLARWGRLGRDRARFYTAEVVEGVSGLHQAGIIYRDLKPENILISVDGHIVLTDFGLCKYFGLDLPIDDAGASLAALNQAQLASRQTTTTFCGTAEYLAPEVLLGEPYSYEADSWSLGTMLYEMLYGLTPFWCEDHTEMYKRVLHEELRFEETEHAFDDDTQSLLRALLEKDPLNRISMNRAKDHPYFSMIDWTHVKFQRYVPPYIPAVDPLDPMDTSQFDTAFLNMSPEVEGANSQQFPGFEKAVVEGEPLDPVDEFGRDVFDGYSYYGDSDSQNGMTSMCSSPSINVEQAVPDIIGKVVAEEIEGSLDLLLEKRSNEMLRGTSSECKLPEASCSTSPHVTVCSSQGEIPPSSPSFHIFDSEKVRKSESSSMSSGWDVVEGETGEACNGGKMQTLWGRGVVDKYRLYLNPSVFPLSQHITGFASIRGNVSSKGSGIGSLRRARIDDRSRGSTNHKTSQMSFLSRDTDRDTSMNRSFLVLRKLASGAASSKSLSSTKVQPNEDEDFKLSTSLMVPNASDVQRSSSSDSASPYPATNSTTSIDKALPFYIGRFGSRGATSTMKRMSRSVFRSSSN